MTRAKTPRVPPAVNARRWWLVEAISRAGFEFVPVCFDTLAAAQRRCTDVWSRVVEVRPVGKMYATEFWIVEKQALDGEWFTAGVITDEARLDAADEFLRGGLQKHRLIGVARVKREKGRAA